jgi:uncharacterized protein (TIGR03435 family)
MQRTAIAVLIAFGSLHAQKPSLTFEVASIKPSPAGATIGQIRPSPGGERYLANNVPLMLMIAVAYRIKADQVIGGPDWINADRFDMNAKAEKPSTVEELHTMLMNLLADRFQLKFHREMKELPVYALTVDKGGAKLKAHTAENAGEPWIDAKTEQVVSVAMKAKQVPMDYFAWRLGMLLDRPVTDLTNLKGGYDFDLSYTRDLPPGIPEGAMLNGVAIDTSGPTLFQALTKQLGLRLEKQKGPVEVLVVDHVTKPTAN